MKQIPTESGQEWRLKKRNDAEEKNDHFWIII